MMGTDTTTDSAPAKAPGGTGVALAGAAVCTAAFYVYGVLTYDPTNLANGFLYMTVFGLPAMAFLFGLAFLAVRWVYRRMGRRTHAARWRVGAAVGGLALCAGLLLIAWRESRPEYLFSRDVLSPVPASLADLRISQFNSFGDGSMQAYAFRVSPADFDAILRRHRLEPVDMTARMQDLAVMLEGVKSPEEIRQLTDQAFFPVEFPLPKTGLYQRPAEPEFYRADRITLVTDRKRSVVYMLFNRMSP